MGGITHGSFWDVQGRWTDAEQRPGGLLRRVCEKWLELGAVAEEGPGSPSVCVGEKVRVGFHVTLFWSEELAFRWQSTLLLAVPHPQPWCWLWQASGTVLEQGGWTSARRAGGWGSTPVLSSLGLVCLSCRDGHLHVSHLILSAPYHDQRQGLLSSFYR